jgi:branched-chain amino acid transport system permease protein
MAASVLTSRRRAHGGRPTRKMVLDYRDDLRIFPSWWARIGLVGVALLYLTLPFFELIGDSGMRTLSRIGIFAIGAIGLNLLAGYTGQISLGHAFFIGVGSYTAAHLGATEGLPFLVYMPAAAVLGFALGAVIGPFALRLRGHYLVIVTLGLIFLGRHIFNNWDSVTGGNRGIRIRGADMSVGPLDFSGLELFGRTYSREASMYLLVWALVALGAILAKNLVRSRTGRAMQAVRDRDLSAEVIGVDLARTKVGAFAWSSAFACVAGVLSGLLIRQAGPDDFGLFLSITYVAVIIIGGVGTIFGPIVGAIFVIGGQELISQNSRSDLLGPLISTGPTDSGWFSVGELNAILFGLFIVLFLLFEPRGLAALWFRAKIWFLTWPFAY